MSEVDEVLRENLSPKALGVLQTARAVQAAGAELSDAVAAVREDACSPEGDVWACADGQGFLTALMIDDAAMSRYTVEELEDVISDALVDASGRGQAAGEAVLGKLDEKIKDLDLSSLDS
ncbi:Nucleoid-associated protein YbaB [Mycobacterium talmoniae]|uniref:Nucleoid-associated protein YbaB n=1 Tax=Mycobacterium talmoniae TaxID=1858794 RepID=A0A2S8BR60_9MYCO|nr:YbaB/EbfC family nucleoid-associated protein [Mycobacterium eburneum]PQM49168.1 Nucleoid-associated protein YbaB [Mycobacterium talmoniae]TDH48139.1 YbaB/EbfC family DNA-binding protein [Mycobacterium eburneum]